MRKRCGKPPEPVHVRFRVGTLFGPALRRNPWDGGTRTGHRRRRVHPGEARKRIFRGGGGSRLPFPAAPGFAVGWGGVGCVPIRIIHDHDLTA